MRSFPSQALWASLPMLMLAACGAPASPPAASNAPIPESHPATAPVEGAIAAVEGVTVSGEPGRYRFTVTIRSEETGCDRYADWWEVISASEELLYRRILAHSHVDEQPFTRAGGPISLQPGERITVRVHMNNSGYSPHAYQGTIDSAGTGQFGPVTLEPNFANALAQQAPLPSGCAF